MARSSSIFRSRNVALAGAVVWLAAACGGPHGTDEASRFGGFSPDAGFRTDQVSYSQVKSEVLQPFQCLKCHSEFGTEAGLAGELVPGNPDASKLFQRITSGGSDRMPPGGPAVQGGRLELVRSYIVGLAARRDGAPASSVPATQPPANPPIVPSAPTWASVQKELLQSSCVMCHKPGSAKFEDRPTLMFASLDDVKAEADSIFEQISSVPPQMPPRRSSAPRPTPEAIAHFKSWMDAGFPQ